MEEEEVLEEPGLEEMEGEEAPEEMLEEAPEEAPASNDFQVKTK